MKKKDAPVIYWIRDDLRIHDNIALLEATKSEKEILLVYFRDYTQKSENTAEGLWVRKSFEDLKRKYKEIYNADILCLKGDPKKEFDNLHKKFGVSQVYINEIFDPKNKKKDSIIKDFFLKKITFIEFNSNLLFNPGEIKNNSGSFFKVYTPFWKNCLSKLVVRKPLKPPKVINTFNHKHIAFKDTTHIHYPNWALGLFKYFTPGEDSAREQLMKLGELIRGYSDNRDYPIEDSTSKLSMYFARGELSVNEVMFHMIKNKSKINMNDYNKFISQLGWREFSYNILHNFPNLESENFNKKFNNFEWDSNNEFFIKWKRGQTGYPIVDAGMRELYKTGYMHNRVRMITASFLVKDLLIDWRLGREWFEQTLFDHDIANNSAGWQWVAGSGTDAAPYFRIFNPSLQSERFDKEGKYIKKWIPELENIPSKFVHSPWICSSSDLEIYNIELGKTYPYPIVNHKAARDRALKLYKKLK